MSLPSILRDRLRLPVVASPMFTVSGPDLVIAQCTSGVVGSFPSLNARPQGLLDDWLTTISDALAKHDANHPEAPSAPYAVNLIVHRTNARLDADLETVIRHEVPIVITSLGARAEVNDAVHAYGGIVLHDVVHDGFARKAIEKGADGLIAVAAGAGGHGGSQSPFALVQEIRTWFDGPVVLSGAIAHGRSVLAAQAAGADLAYVGSAFIATHEALADDRYKRMVVDSAATDIVYSDLFTGVPGNYLRGSIEASGLDPDRLSEQDRAVMSWADGTSKVKAWSQVWGSGQGIGVVDAVLPAADLVDRLADEYHSARARLIG
ncbi:nitronate monooxygenase family protein [Nocardioides sp. CCNWLW239]|uniref:NAD(P)H-dependent flavin oxidoreductase n=1 Tax=Nocardioides sp. CCNWLW239 TaxID=3128902 RepID=UPI00301677B3